MSYTERLIATNLLPLEFLREISDLLLVFKAKTGLIPMDINNYLCTYEPDYKSRNYDENNFNFLTKQQYFRNSFFIRSASLWNSIPSDLKICNRLNSFRTSLRNITNQNYLLTALLVVIKALYI